MRQLSHVIVAKQRKEKLLKDCLTANEFAKVSEVPLRTLYRYLQIGKVVGNYDPRLKRWLIPVTSLSTTQTPSKN
mgnify:CR=1 FL=1